VPRLFVAVRPPEVALDDLAGVLDDDLAGWPGGGILAGRARWHVTIAFIGEVADPGPSIDALGRAVVGVAAPELRLAGAGRFGTSCGPAYEVIWLRSGPGWSPS